MKKSIRIVIGIAVLCVVLIMVATVVNVRAQSGSSSRLEALPAGAPYQPSASELKLAQVYQQAVQSVVNISVVTMGGGAGTGSGFVIDADGHIVTNNHVVESARYIEVAFVDGISLPADLVGRNPDSDLAVIRVDPAKAALVPVTFADSNQVFVGQQVMAIGNPFGQDFTLTTGIVSALDRSLRNENQFSIPELIQTDAAINPGNSGGPLLDMEGRVIGVNTAILSGSRSASGVGFAVPSNTVRRIVPYLIRYGKYEHSWLGITGATLTLAQNEALNLPADQRGVMVTEIARSGPAARAGLIGASRVLNTPLQPLPLGGDIIVAINGSPITTMSDLISYLENNTLPGDTVVLTILRGNTTLSINVTLGARPG